MNSADQKICHSQKMGWARPSEIEDAVRLRYEEIRLRRKPIKKRVKEDEVGGSNS